MSSKKNIQIIKKKIVADFLTPVAAFTCFKDNKYSFILESVEKGKTDRYSFIGLSPRWIYKLYYDRVEILSREAETYILDKTIDTVNPMEVIQEVLNDYVVKDTDDELPPFCGGLVGYTSYEIIKSWEKIEFSNVQNPELPLGIFIFTDEVIAFDHLYNTADIIKLVIDGENEDNSSFVRIDEIISSLEKIPESILPFSLKNKKDIEIKSNFTEKVFKEKVLNVKDAIVSGEIIQGVFSQRLEVQAEADPFNYYRALRIINPSPYMFYLKLDDIILCGSSPEVLVKIKGNKVLLRPIAGTRPRGKTEEEEKNLAEELKADIKERAEHIMLVDLGRNDLGRVCESGTVKVSNLMAVEKYSHVIHMVTDVTGELLPDISNIEVFKSCFPAGTVSGAPKIRAIQIIEEQENIARGPYAGSVGYFSFTGDMDMCITIRTMVIHKGRVYVQAGAGIVADSVPEKEYQETLNKAKALLEAVRLGESGEKK